MRCHCSSTLMVILPRRNMIPLTSVQRALRSRIKLVMGDSSLSQQWQREAKAQGTVVHTPGFTRFSD